MKMLRPLFSVFIVLSASALPAEDRRSDKSRLIVMTLNAEFLWDGVDPEAGSPRSFAIADVTVHFDRFELETSDGAIELTTREMALLRALIEREGAAVTRGDLLEEVWGLRPETKTRVVDSFIVRLRRYVEPDPTQPGHILSVRGHGYRLHR